MKKGFKINGLEYEAYLSKKGDFSFALVGGSSKKGSYLGGRANRNNLFPNDPVYDDVNLNGDALTVYKAAGDILLEWFYAVKPWRIGFSASTGRKVKIYRWFAKRLGKKLANYTMIEAPFGTFSFYRLPED